jgi:hypothetical protein
MKEFYTIKIKIYRAKVFIITQAYYFCILESVEV